MIIYRHAVFFVFFLLIFQSCRQIKDNKSPEFRGRKQTTYELSKESNKMLVFNREYLDTLTEKANRKMNEYNYSLVQKINDTIISLLDYGKSHISFIDQNLNEVTEFSDTSIKTVLSYSFSENSLFVYDFGNKILKKYLALLHKKNGITLTKESSLPSPTNGIYRVAPLEGNKFLAVYPDEDKNDLVFCTTEFTSDTMKKTDSILLSKILPEAQKVAYVDMAYDGDFVWDNSSDLVYKFRFSSGFIKFNYQTGEYLYLSQTIDRIPPPIAKYVPITSRAKRLEISPNILFFPSNCISEHHLYVLNFITSSKDAVVDVYNLNNMGAYIKSVYIPTIDNGKYPKSITAIKEFLYVLYENNRLLKYKINEL